MLILFDVLKYGFNKVLIWMYNDFFRNFVKKIYLRVFKWCKYIYFFKGIGMEEF